MHKPQNDLAKLPSWIKFRRSLIVATFHIGLKGWIWRMRFAGPPVWAYIGRSQTTSALRYWCSQFELRESRMKDAMSLKAVIRFCNLIQSVSLFEVYEGWRLEEGKKPRDRSHPSTTQQNPDR